MIFSYLNANDNMNVIAGTKLRKAQEKVADVYLRPMRKKYCVRVSLNILLFRNSQQITNTTIQMELE